MMATIKMLMVTGPNFMIIDVCDCENQSFVRGITSLLMEGRIGISFSIPPCINVERLSAILYPRGSYNLFGIQFRIPPLLPAVFGLTVPSNIFRPGRPDVLNSANLNCSGSNEP